ncbi:MAG: hypothetical protein KKD35_08355 [Elusimicrobia bacterium]|nr:hypothetical protein [Elusimicrobiota bacterium]
MKSIKTVVLIFLFLIGINFIYAENNFILFSDEKIKISGGAIINGNIHSNGEITISGNGTVNGSTTKKPAIPFPSQNGILKNFPNYTLIDHDLKINNEKFNGIYLVNGNVHISGKAIGELTIIATGDIKIDGDCKLTSTDSGLVFYTQDGEISVSGNSQLKGKIIAEKIKISGNVEIDSMTGFKPTQTYLPGTDNLMKQPPLIDKPLPDPWKYSVQYTLKEDAEVYVTIVNQRRMPVNTFAIQPGEEGSRKGENKLILWLGNDQDGNEMPEGRYFAFQIIKYSNGEEEIKIYPLEK